MNEKNINWFSRILILLVGLFIGSIIYYNFYIKELGTISNGLIFLICLLIIIISCEIFDDLSFGMLLSLKKKIKDKKEHIVELKTEKQNLLNVILSNFNCQSQVQSTGISPSELTNIIRIVKADPEKIKEENKEKEEVLEKINKDEPIRKRIDIRKIEDIGINRFINENSFDKMLLNKQIQVDSKDPISAFNPVFDGYLNNENLDIFIEVKLQRTSLFLRENIYQRLMNVYFYRKFKQSNAYLQLILIELPEDKENNRIKNTNDRIKKDFLPAIESGLLKISCYKLSENEVKEIYKK